VIGEAKNEIRDLLLSGEGGNSTDGKGHSSYLERGKGVQGLGSPPKRNKKGNQEVVNYGRDGN